MNETQPQLQRAPDVHTYHYPPPVPCTECGGAGRIALLARALRGRVTTCDHCGLSNRMATVGRKRKTDDQNAKPGDSLCDFA
jgi:hypothetical protein